MLTPKMQILERQWQADTQSGENLHFELCKGGYFSNKEEYGLKVVGKTFRDGTPTPEQCVKTGSEIRVYGKNLLSHITTYNEPWTATLPECDPITFEAGKTYTISFAQPPSGKWRTMIYSDVFSADDGDYYWVSGFGYGSSNIFSYGRIQYQFTNLTGNSLSFVPNHTFIAYGIQVWNIESTPAEIVEPQLEIGSVATAYEPYVQSQSITTPCDLYSGEIWYPMSGKVYKQDGSVEQYNPQPIFAPQGTVNVIQEPVELSAELSATMLCKGGGVIWT